MSKLQKISSTHYRIVCDCGEFIHEITKGEKGIELDSYMVARADEEPEESPKPVKQAPKPEKKKSWLDEFFGDSEESEKSDEDEES